MRFIFLLFLFPIIVIGQCDVELIYYDFETHEVSITTHNGSGCIGDGVQKLQLGMHKPGLDSNWMYCSNPINHPGYVWFPTINWDSAPSNNAVPELDPDGDGYLTEGDTCTFNILDLPYIQSDYYWCWFEMVEQAYADGCVEIVLWQINLSQTSHVWEGGWATSPSGISVGNYPDVNIEDNSVSVEDSCYCVTDTFTVWIYADTLYEYSVDTIVEYVEVELWDTLIATQIDTLIEYVQIPPDTVITIQVDTLIEYVWDTLLIVQVDTVVEFVELPPDTIEIEIVDTLYLNVFDTTYIDVHDTLYIQVVDTVFFYQNDTLIEYLVETIYIDCATGLFCNEIPEVDDCNGASIYIPNAFSPNNDGLNDAWGAIAQNECWEDWNLKVFNRWGEVIWQSTSPEHKWIGGDDYYSEGGMYSYIVSAKRKTDSKRFSYQGVIVILR